MACHTRRHGATLTGLSLLGMALAAGGLQGNAAGGTIVLMLVLLSLARGLCSVSAKDVLSKTVSKSRRGTVMGWSVGLSGLAFAFIDPCRRQFDVGHKTASANSSTGHSASRSRLPDADVDRLVHELH